MLFAETWDTEGQTWDMFGESVIVKNCSGHATRHPNEDAEKAAAFYNTGV